MGSNNKLHLVSFSGPGLCFFHLTGKTRAYQWCDAPHLSPLLSTFCLDLWISQVFRDMLKRVNMCFSEPESRVLAQPGPERMQIQPFHHSLFCLALHWETSGAPEVRPSRRILTIIKEVNQHLFRSFWLSELKKFVCMISVHCVVPNRLGVCKFSFFLASELLKCEPWTDSTKVKR